MDTLNNQEILILFKVAITCDSWTSRATDSYITITATCINNDWNLKNFVLQTRPLNENHTSEHVAEVIEEAITEWGLDQHPPMVTDNAANMVRAAEILKSEPHIGCYAYTINLAVQKCLKISRISKLRAHVRRILA